jgi:hypothetical protein
LLIWTGRYQIRFFLFGEVPLVPKPFVDLLAGEAESLAEVDDFCPGPAVVLFLEKLFEALLLLFSLGEVLLPH